MEEHEAKLAYINAFVRCLPSFTLEMLMDTRDALNLEITLRAHNGEADCYGIRPEDMDRPDVAHFLNRHRNALK